MKFKCVFLMLALLTMKAYSMNNKYFLELVVNSEKINYNVMFNDVSVFNEVSQSPVTNTVPLNQWLIKGKNELRVLVNFKTDVKNESDIIEKSKAVDLIASLMLRVVNGGGEKKYKLTEFNIKPDANRKDYIAGMSLENLTLDSEDEFKLKDQGDISVGPWIAKKPKKTWMAFSQNVDLNVFPIPEWSYLSADFIDDKAMSDSEFYALSDELYDEYKKIWNLLKDKKVKELLSLIQLRSAEYDEAFFLDEGSKIKEFERSLTSAFENEDLYLSDIVDTENANLRVMANGRIAKLKIAGSSEPLIYYSHKRGSFTRFYDFYFMRKNGKWIIIR
ncbi:hypothetical protein TDB9533_00515 [Thalassocella blandensis]|nr:hypothetical protein TDB9533_00515 [Thalassocella blandensis]